MKRVFITMLGILGSLFLMNQPASAAFVDYNLSAGDAVCDNPDNAYSLHGKTKEHSVLIRGGSKENPIKVDLHDLDIQFLDTEDDGNSKAASPITIEENSYVQLFIGKDSPNTKVYLSGGNHSGAGKNWGYAGICVEEGATLVIGGEGSLTAIGGGVQYGAAGIGSNYNDNVSKIIIDGNMDITAKGGYSGAGIGSGRDGIIESIVIKKGKIHAEGGRYGAGIGSGDAVGTGSGGNADQIEILGGTIEAIGGEHAAGIGTGEGGACKNLSISNATIVAKGGEIGAGIGGGQNSSVDQIQIKDADITATGGEGAAGIGGAEHDIGTISLKGTGTISAWGGKKASAIGNTESYSIADLTLEGEYKNSLVIEATGNNNEYQNISNAAIVGSGNGNCGNIVIKNAKMLVKGYTYGACIGSGSDVAVTSQSMDKIYIENSTLDVKAVSTYGACIGSGDKSKINQIEMKDTYFRGGRIGSSSDMYTAVRPSDMDSIIIKGCDIGVTPNPSSFEKIGAGIGTGASGNIKEIRIEDSKIDSKGSAGGPAIGSAGILWQKAFLKRSGGKVDRIYISNSEITGTARNSEEYHPSVIGSGSRGDMGVIEIYDSTVYADMSSTSGGGSAIGSGSLGDLDQIIIERSNVVAKASDYGTGIGVGGQETGSGIKDTTGNKIRIYSSTVEAYGGFKGAGIGSGCGAKIENGSIKILDSIVTAKGGEHAAGIGAGGESASSNSGGEAGNIKIIGKSKVKAYGGRFAPGVGSGDQDSVSGIHIDLTTTENLDYYLETQGGDGASGIGAGTGTASDIIISGGHVIAKGGKEADGHTGSGIGGEDGLQGFYVNGGVVEAYAGGDKAFDIGKADKSGKDKDFVVTNGTVLAKRWSQDAKPIISGGSVLANIDGVKNDENIPVYHTVLSLTDLAFAPLKNLKTNASSYGTKDVFSDQDQQVYLYLPNDGEWKAFGNFEVADSTREYYGTAQKDGKGRLKMGGQINFKPAKEEPAVGKEFQLELEDEEFAGTKFEFEVSGSAELVEVEQDTAPGARIKLKAKDFGDYKIEASAPDFKENLYYWGAVGEYQDKITKSIGAIEVKEDPSKIYDAKPVENPEIEKTGDGEVTYSYYRGDFAEGEALEEAPTHAGTYTVQASLAASEHYTSAVSEPKVFTIEKRKLTMDLSGMDVRDGAKITAHLFGMEDVQGQVKFEVMNPDSGQLLKEEICEIRKNGNEFQAELSFDLVQAGRYRVTATYLAPADGDYICEAPAVKDMNKLTAYRQIQVPAFQLKTYGDAPFSLGAATNKATNEDIWNYEVIKDENSGEEDVISVNKRGKVTILNVGKATVKVTLIDGRDPAYYGEAVAYSYIEVSPTKLRVTVYAEKDGEKITETPYGTLEDVTYGLDFKDSDFIEGDTEESFKDRHPEIQAVGPMATLGVSDEPYQIGIEHAGTVEKYNVIPQFSTIKVTPAEMTVQADSVEGTYGKEPDYTWSLKGVTPWDTEETIFQTKPDAYFDEKKAGKSYKELMPGIYKDVIAVTEGKQLANTAGKENYKIKVQTGDLTIHKSESDLKVSAKSKVYDGKPAEVQASKDAKLEYYEGTPSKVTKLEQPPVDVGSYCVRAITKEDATHKETMKEVSYEIKKADPKVELPILEDLSYEENLTLQQQNLPKGWTWKTPELSLNPGTVSEIGIFTPDDQRNYNTVEKKLEFHVLPGMTATVEAFDTTATIQVKTQKTAWTYFLEGSTKEVPSKEEVRKNGQGVDTESGSATISLDSLTQNTKYTYYLVSEVNGCLSDIEKVTFITTKSEGKIRIVQDLNKVYDAEPVNEPAIEKNGEGAVTYLFFKGKDTDGTALKELPVNAGTYTVQAVMEETEKTKGAVSNPLTFVIEKKEVFLELSAKEEGTDAQITARVYGLLEENGKITFDVNGKKEMKKISFKENTGEAVLDFKNIKENDYKVTATYTSDSTENYFCAAPVEKTFSKTKDDREIVMGEVPEKMYGDQPFNLQASTNHSSDEDQWSYEVVSSLDDPAVSIDENGKVEILNAGEAVVRVTLSEKGEHHLYNDEEAYVVIKVQKAPLHICSYVSKEGEEITKIPYGQAGNLEYGIRIAEEDLKNQDTLESFATDYGTFSAKALEAETDVCKDPYEIAILKTGVNGAFTCRNYELVEDKGSLLVEPAPLTIQAEDVSAHWEETPTFTYTMTGLMDWDQEKSVFETLSKVEYDSKATGVAYEELTPGTYENALKVEAGKQKLNAKGEKNYKIETQPGTLILEKGSVSIQVNAKSKTYDGKPARVEISFDSLKPYTGEAVLTYYDEAETLLEEPPVDAGKYKVIASVPETEQFMAAQTEASYQINKVDAEVSVPELPDLVMKDGLTLKDQPLPTGWTWKNPDTQLEVDQIFETGIFTPEDEKNYNSVEKELTFKVLPSVVANADVKDVTATIYAQTQKGATIYSLKGEKDHEPEVEQLLKQGEKIKAEDGSATITLEQLSPNTEYTYYLLSEQKECRSAIEKVTFTTLKSDTNLVIKENPGKIYDAKKVEDPKVQSSREGEIVYSYYEGTNTTGAKLEEAPKNAGTYTVIASMEESKNAKAGSSNPVTFTIEKRKIAFDLTAYEEGTSAVVKAQVFGLLEENGAISFVAAGESIQPIKKEADGTMAAITTFDPIAENDYTITATYVPGALKNYVCEETVTKSFHKTADQRTVNVENVGEKMYGDENFQLKVSTDRPQKNDQWTYEIIYDSFPQDPTVSVDEAGKVKILNAGTAAIKVSLKDSERFYQDTEAFVTIEVKQAPLHVASYAGTKEHPITSMVYGTLDQQSYGLSYTESEFKNKDNEKNFTKGCGTLEAVPLVKTLGVSEKPYEIGIAKVSEEQPFYSRNYQLIFENGLVNVTPANLKVTADSIKGAWTVEPDYTYQVDGLAAWDGPENAFEELPIASLDTKVAGKDYENLTPGVYKDAIQVSGGTTKNYVVTTKPGTLTIEKAEVGLNVKTESKVYDKTPVDVQVKFDTVKPYEEDATFTYYERKDGKLHKLKKAPTDVGTYMVEVKVEENDFYLSAKTKSYYHIFKAVPKVEEPKLNDLVIKENLKLKDQELPKGWKWEEPEEKLEVGEKYAEAVFTPKDTRNYKSVTKELCFNVLPSLEVKADPQETTAVLNGTTQKGAVVYYIKADEMPSVQELLEKGIKEDTTGGIVKIQLKNLKEDTNYTYYLVSKLNGCSSEIQKVTFKTMKKAEKLKENLKHPNGPADSSEAQKTEASGSTKTGDTSHAGFYLILFVFAVAGLSEVVRKRK